MTRIITICSGLARVGKTHLAVNLALEMVRRGRQAAIFNQDGPASSIDDLLAMPRTGLLQRRSTDHGSSLVRRGYLGIDVLSSGIPLSQWDHAEEQVLQKIIADMDCADGYDDFLVDTSGMDPRTLLACCRAAPLVILVITADARSRSEAFALLRILQLNGFEGGLCLLVNQVDRDVDANELHHAFNDKLKEHLGLDVPFLGMLVNDLHVGRAERSKQAFTSLFPDAEVSSQIGTIANAIDAAASPAVAAPQDLSAYWNSFREILALPVSLPGGVFLEVSDDALQVPQARESANEVMLLQFESSFHTLQDALDSLPGLLQATAGDVSSLRRLLEADNSGLQDEVYETTDSGTLLRLAVGLLREIEQAVVPARVLQLQVNENRVRGDDPDWLQAGCYLKYIFSFQGEEAALLRIRSFLAGVAGFHSDSGQLGETLWEMVVADRSGAMNIIHSADDSIRVQIWLPLRDRPETAQGSQPRIAAATLTPGKRIH